MRKILVIGRSGQLASALAQQIGAADELVALGRDEMDITQTERIGGVIRQHRPDGVINASAYNAVDAAESDPAPAFAVNRDGPTALAAACAEIGAPLVHVSTDYVFGNDKDGAYVESDRPAPMNAYGRSKAAGEAGVLSAGGVAAIVRTCWVYSPGGKNFVTMMLGLAREGRSEVRVVADEVGRPTYAPDLAQACLAILKALEADDERARGVLHYCGADDASRAEFAEAIFEGARARGLPSAEVRRITAAEFGAPAPRPGRSLLDTSLVRQLPGVVVHSWRDRLAACLDRIAVQ